MRKKMASKKVYNDYSIKSDRVFFAREETAEYEVQSLSPYYFDPINSVKLYLGDSVEILRKVPSNCIDVIFADPPYFLSNGGITCHAGKMVSVNKGAWDKSLGTKEDHEFSLRWLAECQRVLKENGTIWISGTAHVIYSIGYALQELEYKLLNDIVWYKKNAPPNLSCRYFTHSTETILWAAKNKKSKHYYDYGLMRETNGGKQMRNVWEISAPGKDEKKFGSHPTQKPLKLLERIILASTPEKALVLDPFCGSSSTGVAAVRLKRRYVGIDNNEEFLKLSIMRIEHEMRHPAFL
jgi:site-specific DNA-methyltransferase (adenine-specific)